MGSAFSPGRASEGVIPKAMEDIFSRIRASTDAEYAVRVGFVEIYQVSSPHQHIIAWATLAATQKYPRPMH